MVKMKMRLKAVVLIEFYRALEPLPFPSFPHTLLLPLFRIDDIEGMISL